MRNFAHSPTPQIKMVTMCNLARSSTPQSKSVAVPAAHSPSPQRKFFENEASLAKLAP
jgi:hypothetical protein